MNISVQQASFCHDLRLLASVVDRKVTIPILAGVRLTATSSGELRCETTNLDNSLTLMSRADSVATQGAAVVALDVLLALLHRFPDGTCDLALESTCARLSSGKASAKVQAFPLEDYPSIPMAGEPTLRLPAAALVTLIGRVRHAVGDTTVYPAGIYCAVSDGVFRLAATDKYQIAEVKHIVPTGPQMEFGAPDRGWDALMKALAAVDGKEEIALAVTDHAVTWTSSRWTLASKLFDKEFPQYQRVIPKEMAFDVAMPFAPLADVLRRHVVLATKDRRRIDCDIEGSCLHVRTKTSIGEAADDVELPSAAEARTEFSVNPTFLLSALDAAAPNEQRFAVSTYSRAVLVRSGDAGHQVTNTIATMR